MFIRANTDATTINLRRVSYEDLVEMQFDAIQQHRLDGNDDVDMTDWAVLLAAKRAEQPRA